MLSENQESFLKSLHEMRDDMIGDIEHAERELVGYKIRLNQINSAIVNMEEDRDSI